MIIALALGCHVASACAEPPSILSQPESQVVLLGRPASFSVSASGSEPRTYQWQANGTNIPNATNATLIFPSVTTVDPLPLTVTVSNPEGSIQSRKASLTVFDFSAVGSNRAPILTIWGFELSWYDIWSVDTLSASNVWQTNRLVIIPVNVNTASVALLSQIPDIDQSMAENIVSFRAGPDGVEGTEDDIRIRGVSELWFLPPQAFAYLTIRTPPAVSIPVWGPGLPNPHGGAVPGLTSGFFRIVLLE